nr:hypothetical protein GCM10017547_20500 [Pseudarthrobacter oxydans]
MQTLVPESFTSFVKKYTLIPLAATTMSPALEEAVLRSTAALAGGADVADGGVTDAAGAVAEAGGEPSVTAGLVVAGAVPGLPPQAASAAERARTASPAPTLSFMALLLAGGPGVGPPDANPYDAPG